jgi:hypothetical protein
VANNEINDNKKQRQIAGNFNGHADVAVQCVVHRPIAHIQGFTRSHWMLLLGGACAVLPQWPPRSSILDANTKTQTKHNF